MEAKFLVNPLLKSGKKSGKTKGVETIRTDLLMLTTISGLGLGRSPQAVDERLAGRLSEKMKMKKFKGTLGENLTLHLGDDFPARNVVLIGLGAAATFDVCGLEEVVGIAVSKAVAMGCKRLSLEIHTDRLTAAQLNLKGTAYAIKECVAKKLAELARDQAGTLEVELICTPQGASHLKEGLDIAEMKIPACKSRGEFHRDPAQEAKVSKI